MVLLCPQLPTLYRALCFEVQALVAGTPQLPIQLFAVVPSMCLSSVLACLGALLVFSWVIIILQRTMLGRLWSQVDAEAARALQFEWDRYQLTIPGVDYSQESVSSWDYYD